MVPHLGSFVAVIYRIGITVFGALWFWIMDNFFSSAVDRLQERKAYSELTYHDCLFFANFLPFFFTSLLVQGICRAVVLN